jgi:hypothetical protein
MKVYSFAVAPLVILLSLITGYQYANNGFERERRNLARYESTYLRKQGCEEKLCYDLRSLDAGKTWYAVEYRDDKVIVLGPAEKVHPGLMARVDATRKLVDYVIKNGPIDPTKPDQLKQLEGTGFAVTK